MDNPSSNASVLSPIVTSPRDVVVERLREDLLGPSSEKEVIPERPSDRYLTGLLYPQKTDQSGADDDSLGSAGTGDDDSDDTPPALNGTYKPASCGVSFALKPQAASKIEVRVACARYRQFHVDPKTGAESALKEHAKRANERWQRLPLAATERLVVDPREHTQTVKLEKQGIPGLELFVRTARSPDATIITLALMNTLSGEGDRAQTEANTFFQVSLRVTPQDPAVLVARPAPQIGDDRDSKTAALIYRHVREWAVGHTCSTAWSEDLSPPAYVTTEWLPSARVRRMKPEGDEAFRPLRAHAELKPLSPRWMASEASDSALGSALALLPEIYAAWLGDQEGRIAELPPALHDAARRNLGDCRVAVARMQKSVDLIRRDASVRAAWRLACAAMHLQFEWTKKSELMWHPFQLGFQLLVLHSLVEETPEARDGMDLLWFPTGGGKTEAYLALTAFVLFYRRLKFGDAAGSGTSVLMRYTLRLLTVQQFQRAAALVFACEAYRRGEEALRTVPAPKLGETPFSLGLWVGGAATPNRFADAVRALEQRAASSPVQLQRCPKCGSLLSYAGERRRKAIVVRCSGDGCYFGKPKTELPLWTVDDDIYREHPSLVIATVDKFAQLTRNSDTGVFFGLGTPHRPPDLIIQDELHLIAGPLGSLSGLFEMAIDRLCSREAQGKLRRPKVIGSTATIRRADDQVRQLFDREAFQFPPPVLDATNSGFGLEDADDAGRLYVGLTTAGRSAKFALQATYASLLQAATDPRIGGAKAQDLFWTLTGYFNSLKELGGAVTLVMDDVLKSIRAYSRRHSDAVERKLQPPVELTSRVASSEIPNILGSLERAGPGNGAVDVLLASNMISVGVDIRRLGAMVVAAQPKTMAEYIQATSRVGRHAPGIVVVVYNHPRVRDRSHYESFPTWHSALYRAVEATSVTPLASRARDKALHAVVVALARHLVPTLKGAPTLNVSARASVEQLLSSVFLRARNIDQPEEPGVRAAALEFLQDWERRSGPELTAYWDDAHHERALLIGAELAASLEERGEVVQAWAAPNSMREVEPSSLFSLKFVERAASTRRRRTPDASK